LRFGPVFGYNTIAMVKLRCLIALGLFCAKASFAQGTMLFTWHGQNNYFQASFQVTMDETLPGSIFNSSLWTNSIQITSLDGLTYRASDTPTPFIAGHFGPPLSLTFIFADQNTLSRMEADVVPGQGAYMFEDSPLPNGQHGEFGSWSYEIIPEPSIGALFILGASGFIIKKRRVSKLPTLR
jgi:hypothetical protein